MTDTTLADRNFDDLAERLNKNIYGSVKGKLRLNLVWEDMEAFIPTLSESPAGLQVLDAGGGFGQLSGRLAERGHRVVLCDASQKMLEKAEEDLAGRDWRDRVTLVHSKFQDLPDSCRESFDIIMLHAVLEWLEHPETSLERLMTYLKPGGYISLMFYNKDSLVFSNAIKGNFFKIRKGDFRGQHGGLTPINPIFPADVESWFENWKMEKIAKTGIRVFYDYMFRKLRDERSFEDILELEKKLYRTEPYASMGRYVHMIGKK